MKEKKKHSVFIEGPVSPDFIAGAIGRHSQKTDIGAHAIFLGQVRRDQVEGKVVKAIDYSAYVDMAEEKMQQIREEAFRKFDLSCMHVYHSFGKVPAGEICLFVFVSSVHRAGATEACSYVVEEIKAGLPVWGREIFEDETHTWKINKIKIRS